MGYLTFVWVQELDRGTLQQTRTLYRFLWCGYWLLCKDWNSHTFENIDRSKNQLEALLIRTLIGLECVVLQTVAPSHYTSLLFIIFWSSFRLWSDHHHEHWLTYFINECLLLIKYLYTRLCIISKTEKMFYLASCPVKTLWHFNLVFAFWYDGLTLSNLDFLSTWHEFCLLIWYVLDHLIIFYPICWYRSALFVLRIQRSWPLAVGTWWAELNSLIYCAFHLSLIYIVLQFFFTKLISLQTCRDCGSELTICPICHESVTNRQRVYI